jgi:hypothetical protein
VIDIKKYVQGTVDRKFLESALKSSDELSIDDAQNLANNWEKLGESRQKPLSVS